MKIKGKIAICGDFFGKNITGVQRVAYELVKELDKIAKKDEIVLVVPNNIINIPSYKNIEVIPIHGDNGNRHLWIQLWYGMFLVRNKMIGLTICNELPIIKPGIAYLHDIYYKLYPKEFVTFKDKISRAVVLTFYKCIVSRAKFIVTVSETGKNEIIDNYNVSDSRIKVLGTGWQHILDIKSDESIFDIHKDIKKGEYYFTLGSLTKRKNVKWVIEYAKKNPKDMFVLSGKIPADDSYDLSYANSLDNVKYLGYISDEQIVALYKNCKAFIFPSIYEGFGMPPMEAMAVGAKAIVSKASCLPEVYEDTVFYIDPFDTNINLDKLLREQPVSSAEKVLNKYSWKASAEGVYDVIGKVISKDI